MIYGVPKREQGKLLANTTVAIGRFTKPHGVGGELVFLPYVHELAILPDLYERQVTLCRQDAPIQQRRIIGWRPCGKRALVRIEGCENRTVAEAFRGYEVLIPQAWFPALAEGEYYWFEIEGLTVYTSHGRYVGKIVDIIYTGSNDVYVVQGEEGELLVPALKQVIQSIDLTRGEMRLAVAEEYFA